jgi:hypothetical protein
MLGMEETWNLDGIKRMISMEKILYQYYNIEIVLAKIGKM